MFGFAKNNSSFALRSAAAAFAVAACVAFPSQAWADDSALVGAAGLTGEGSSVIEAVNASGENAAQSDDLSAAVSPAATDGLASDARSNTSASVVAGSVAGGEEAVNAQEPAASGAVENAPSSSQSPESIQSVDAAGVEKTASKQATASVASEQLEVASAQTAIAVAASATTGWDEQSGQVRYYDADGSAHIGWLVTDSYKNYGLQRYWFGADGLLAYSKLIDAADAGWWAYATECGYVVRGRYTDSTTGYVYFANNDGKLEDTGWLVTSDYGQGLQRYWIDEVEHAAVPGYSSDGWDHYTIKEGYVLRGTYTTGQLVYLANNDGLLASVGWVVSSDYGHGLQRYWVDSSKHAAIVGQSSAGWDHYTTSAGYVLRGASTEGGNLRYANNDGLLVTSGWLVTDEFGQGLQRYWISNGKAAKSQLVDAGNGWWAYARSEGYVVRGSYSVGDLIYLANNDGCLASAGWVVSSDYGYGLQRYWIDSSKHAAVVGYSSEGWDHYTTSEGYVLRGAVEQNGEMYYANNDGVIQKSGWLVTDGFGHGLQRYWLSDCKVVKSQLVNAGDGWWAYARPEGYVVRGSYATDGLVYLADNDGRLSSADGWQVTDAFGQGLQRYYIYADKHAAVIGYSTDGWEHYTTNEGYVVRGTYVTSDGYVVRADNDGCLLKTLNGIDIHPDYQAGIDLSAVDADFVIVKATQGVWQDLGEKASALADQALAAGKMIGFYHFVDTRVSAESQAEHFYNVVKDYVGRAVLALDWENNDATGYNNVDAGTEYAKRFLDRLYELSGVKAVIYMNRGVVHSYDWSSVADSGYNLWVAQYLYKYYDEENGTDGHVTDPSKGTYGSHGTDDFGAWGSSPLIYQYTSTGLVSGYSKQLDCDVFYGNANTWKQLASRS